MGDIYPEHPKLTREKLNEIEQRLGWAPGDRWPVPEHIHLWAWKADALLAENASLRAQLAQARHKLLDAMIALKSAAHPETETPETKP